MKFVMNTCFGGFGLSEEAYQWLISNKGWKTKICDDSTKLYHKDTLKLMEDGFQLYTLHRESTLVTPTHYLGDTSSLEFRSNPDVVACVEALGKNSFGMCAKLEIVNCPLPIEQLEIDEYDGKETLQTIPQRF